MPTFKNNTSRPIIYTGIIQSPNDYPQKQLIIFDPNQEVKLDFWVPYEKLGLTLTNENSPAVPSTVLVSGTFSFGEGTERKYSLEECDTYIHTKCNSPEREAEDIRRGQ